VIAFTWPSTGLGWVIFALIVVLIISLLTYLHVRDESLRSIRLGVFLERVRHDEELTVQDQADEDTAVNWPTKPERRG
jgi:hypothetical protein